MTEQPVRIPTYYIHQGGNRVLAGQRVPWGLAMLKLLDVHKGVGGGGEGVLCGICDTGWTDHPDLPKPKFVRNFTRESNGYDRNGHGTHVAGTIGARDNAEGVVGVAPRCDLASYRCLDSGGSGSSDWIAAAITAAFEDGCHVINLSLGGPYHRGTEDAIKEAVAGGCIVIVAAGNSGDRGMDYPALLPSAYPVASIKSDGTLSNFSSRGKEVAVACPGEQIDSTWLDEKYNIISGTSMACPFMVGVWALLRSAYTNMAAKFSDPQNLRKLVAENATDAGAPGHDSGYGDGIPRVADLVKAVRGDMPDDADI